jgi:hypothetical protein
MVARHPGMHILSSFLYGRKDGQSRSFGVVETVVPWPSDFPTELVLLIFKYLSQAELAIACLVSKDCILFLVRGG